MQPFLLGREAKSKIADPHCIRRGRHKPQATVGAALAKWADGDS
jgi:hypothetical protein